MNKRGFTLVELLATIVIIGLIMGIVLPSATRVSKENQEELYKKYEDMIEEYAAISEDRDKYYIDIETLKDLKEVNEDCDGYVLVDHTGTVPKYDAYIKCGDIYTTEGYNENLFKGVLDMPTCSNKVYNGEEQSLVTPMEGIYTLTNNLRKNVGTQNVLVSIIDKSSFSWEDKSQADKMVRNCEITKRPVTVTADNKTRTYGDSNTQSYTVTIGNRLSGEDPLTMTPSFTIKNSNGDTITLGTKTPFGTYTIVPSTAVKPNYSLESLNNGILTINKKPLTPSISSCSNKTYDGNTTATCTLNTISGVLSGDNISVTISSCAFSDANAGTGKTVTCSVVLGGSSKDNYELTTTSLTSSATINPQPCNAPTNIAISSGGAVTWTTSSNCSGGTHQVKVENGSYVNATSGVDKKSDIIAATGTRTVYVRVVKPNDNYTTSTDGSKSTTVYSVTLTKGTGISSVTGSGTNYITGATATINAALSTGYHWNKWTGTPATTTQNYSGTISSNWSATANGAANTYTVSFNANGGTGGQSANVTATYNSAMPSISTTKPTKTGYTFAGWYDAASGGTQYYKADCTSARAYNKTAAATLYAHWTANTYTVSFNVNGGSGGQSASVTATYGSAMPSISTTKPTKTGYTFAGWYDATSGGTQYYKSDCTSARAYNKAAATTLYAQWTANKIKLTLNPAPGSGGTTAVWYYYGTSKFYSNEACTTQITSITKPSRSGYKFVNYHGDGSSGGNNGERYIAYDNIEFAGDLATDIYKDATMYATWEKNQTCSYVSQGGRSSWDYVEIESIPSSCSSGDPDKKGYGCNSGTSPDVCANPSNGNYSSCSTSGCTPNAFSYVLYKCVCS